MTAASEEPEASGCIHGGSATGSHGGCEAGASIHQSPICLRLNPAVEIGLVCLRSTSTVKCQRSLRMKGALKGAFSPAPPALARLQDFSRHLRCFVRPPKIQNRPEESASAAPA